MIELARAIERRTLVWQTAGRRQKEGEIAEPAGRPAPAPVLAAMQGCDAVISAVGD